MVLWPLAWSGVWACWHASRNWEPVDVPVSLSKGHIRTAEFKIRVESTYWIGIVTDWPWDFERGRCLFGVDPCDGSPSVLAARWAISKKGRVGLRSNISEHWSMGTEKLGRVLGSFHAGPGNYVLDLDVTEDGSRLNAAAPHLVVFEAGGLREATAGVGAWTVLVFVLGASLLICSVIWWRREKLDALARVCHLTELGPQLHAPMAAGPIRITTGHLQRTSALLTASVYAETTGARLGWKPGQPKKPAFAKMSWYGLIAVLCFSMIAIPVCVVVQAQFHIIPKGLRVHLLKTGVSAQVFPGLQPICVRLISPLDRTRPSLYVDAQPVAWEDLETVLQKGLKLRPPSWPVYLDGDPDMEWKWAGNAIDRIRGMQAEVTLLTRPTASSPGESRSRTTSTPAGALQPDRR